MLHRIQAQRLYCAHRRSLRWPAHLLAALLLLGMVCRAAAQDEDESLSRRASAAARAANEARDPASMLELVGAMKALACARKEVEVCRYFEAFEGGRPPELEGMPQLWFGPMVVGTSLARYSFGACVFGAGAMPKTAECIRFGPADQADLRQLRQAQTEQQTGSVDPDSRLFKFLQARSRLDTMLPTSRASGLLVAYRHRNPAAPDADEKPIPTLLRHHDGVLYAATLTHEPVRPGSFDAYPTLTLALLRPLR